MALEGLKQRVENILPNNNIHRVGSHVISIDRCVEDLNYLKEIDNSGGLKDYLLSKYDTTRTDSKFKK